jgi:outer membrane immunogenic protein
MKKLVLGSVAFATVLAGPAVAADMATKAPPAPPLPTPVYSWTGFYFGGGYGYGLWNTDNTIQSSPGVPTIGLNTQGGRGWLGTVVAGYDYQFGDHLVAGVLADFDLADIKGTFTVAGTPAVSGTLTENSAWAAGARLGWLLTPQLLTYVSGGFAQAHFSGVNLAGNTAGLTTGNIATQPSHTYDGWFVGGGVETTFPFLGNGWFFRTDYRFSGYDSASLPETILTGGNLIATNHPYVQTVKSDLVYKFNSGGPTSGASFTDFLRAAQMPASSPRWTGFYVAGGGGYGTWNVETSDQFPNGAPEIGTYTEGGRGWFGTVNAGYDYQFTKLLVAGLFADFDLANIKGTFQDEDILHPDAGTMTENSAWATGVRGGWLLSPQVLNYYDVGFTQAHFSGVNLAGNLSFSRPGTVATIPSHTYSGWFLGSGLEAALPFFGSGWFARVEYRYSEFGSTNLTEVFVPGAGVKDIVTMHPYVQTVRSELVYRF